MTKNQHAHTDPWQRALGPVRDTEQPTRRPKPGPGRHRPEGSRSDPWQRALTGPKLSEAEAS